jgi:hypothetical protein
VSSGSSRVNLALILEPDLAVLALSLPACWDNRVPARGGDMSCQRDIRNSILISCFLYCPRGF